MSSPVREVAESKLANKRKEVEGESLVMREFALASSLSSREASQGEI